MQDKVKYSLQAQYDVFKTTEDATWNNEIQPKIEEVNNKYDTFFTDEQRAQNELLNKELQDAKTNYKKGFSHFGFTMLKVFGLFFSILLIVPAYWAFKKYKQMKNQKIELQAVVDEKTQNKIEFLRVSAYNLDLTNYVTDMLKITKYQDNGPLHDSVIKYIRENSMFALNNNDTTNTYSTSWGVFDKNKIVVNVQEATHYMREREYTASKTVQQGDNIVTVTASVYKPEPVFDFNSTCWFFMSSCSNLELQLLKTYPGANRNLLMNKKPPLENKEFEKSFKWDYNDDIQVRMIFTPYTQEYYVENAFSKKEFRDNYELRKIKSFIGNKYYLGGKSLRGNVYKATQNEYHDLDDIEAIIRRVAIEKIHQSYLALTPGWILPIMQSENHTDALMRINNAPKVPDLSTFHYILNEVFRADVITADTETFHRVTDTCQFFSSYGDPIYAAAMEGKSFYKQNDVEYVTKMTGLFNSVTVEVPYVRYDEVTASKNIYMCYVNNKYSFADEFTLVKENWKKELTEELQPIIQEHAMEDNVEIVVNKNIVTLMGEDLSKEQATKIFDQILPIIKKHN